MPLQHVEAGIQSTEKFFGAGREGEWSAQELEEAAEALGYGAIKYFFLHDFYFPFVWSLQ